MRTFSLPVRQRVRADHSARCDALSQARRMIVSHMLRTIGAIVLAGFTVVTGAASGASPAPNANEACLACHSAADARGSSGKSIAVDGAKFAASVHGSLNLKCTDCHADV